MKRLFFFTILVILSSFLVQGATNPYSDIDFQGLYGILNITDITMSPNCADGEIIKWSSGVGVCGSDQQGSGTYNPDNITLVSLGGNDQVNMSLINSTINASIDLRVDVSFLQSLLDVVYVTFNFLNDNYMNRSESHIQFKAVNDSLNNETNHRINNDTALQNQINSINNLSNDSIKGLFSSGDGNITYSNGVFTLVKLTLGEFTNNLGWITNAVSDLVNYYTKTEVDTKIDSVENFTMQDINDSMKNWSQDKSNYWTQSETTDRFINKSREETLQNYTGDECVAGEYAYAYNQNGTPICRVDQTGSGTYNPDNRTLIREGGKDKVNESWLNSSIDARSVSEADTQLNLNHPLYNITGEGYFNETWNNETINASIVIKVTGQYIIDLGFPQGTTIIDWIDGNSTADRAYTDVRVDSIDNHTPTGNETVRVDLIINDYIPDNSTADRAYTDIRVDSINNLSNDSIKGLFSSGDGNITYSNGVFTLVKLTLGEFTNNLGWITNAVSDLVNYALTTDINTWLSTNKTDTENVLRNNIDTNITKINSEKLNITTQFSGDVTGTYDNTQVVTTQGLSTDNITSGTFDTARIPQDFNNTDINTSENIAGLGFQLTAGAYGNSNFTTNYDGRGPYDSDNFTSEYYAITSRYGDSNFTISLQNYTVIRTSNTTWLDKWYSGISVYGLTNFTTNYDAREPYDSDNFTLEYYAITDRYDTDNFSIDAATYIQNNTVANLTQVISGDYYFNNNSDHKINSNSTCIIIVGDTATLEVC
jgi:hypothetical protein